MNYEKLFEKFIDEVKSQGTYASRGQLREVSYAMLDIIKRNKDKTPEELVEMIIEDNINIMQTIRSNYPIPGYTVGVNTGNINVKLIGGTMDTTGRQMEEQALFDIASMTKFYTQIVAYNLIKDGVFHFDDLVKDVDPRFENVGDLTIGQVLRFTGEFRTNGRLSDKSTIDEALDCLYTMNVVSLENYNYNDMGMMLMKELMEAATGEKYSELFSKYIINPLGLRDTHLVVPEEKIELLTGSPNTRFAKVNDPSALAVGGYSGHAGIFASNDDLIKLGKGVIDGTILPSMFLKDTYTPGIKANRGIMGNTYTSHPKGIDMTYVDILEAKTNFDIQGSTRVQTNIGRNSVSTILLNPSSMGLDRAKEEEAKINKNRLDNGQAPLSLVKHFVYNQNGTVEYDLIDSRLMVPSAKTVELVITENAKLVLRLRFLNTVMEEYDKNYTKEVNVTKRIK